MNLKPETLPIFNYYAPDGLNNFKGLISIPHSGMQIPDEFIPYLCSDPVIYQKDVDFAVDKLVNIERLNNAGVGVIVSNISRACVDLNRSPELCVLNWKSNTLGQKVVVKNPTEQVINELRQKYYAPYFAMLKSILDELESRTKKLVSFVDLHSMPSAPTEYHLKQYPNQNPMRPQFCLSDLNETSCEGKYIFYVLNHLSIKGFDVKINDPYFGGYVSQFASKFRTNTMQIEINRSIYMDEVKQELIFDKSTHLKKDLTDVLVGLFEHFST